MPARNQAAYAKRFRFSDDECRSLSAILKHRNPNAIPDFLRVVEYHVAFLRGDISIANAGPPPTPAALNVTLEKIAKHANCLNAALSDLDTSGSALPFAVQLARLGRGGEIIDYLKSDLTLLHICAESAIVPAENAPSGRPLDWPARSFVKAIGREYKSRFGKKPTYSRGSEFPRLVKAILEVAVPGNEHAAEDNSKLIRSALTEAKIIG